MGVASEATFTVGLDALVAAVKAVEPHALRASKGDEALARVRFIAERTELYVVASNGTTAVMAAVAIDPDSDSRGERVAIDDGVFVLDSEPAEVRNVPRRFLRGRSRKGDAVRRTVRLHFTDHALQLTDVTEQSASLDPDGGVLPEPSARTLGLLMLPPHADYPDVVGDVSKALAGVGESPTAKPLVAEWSTVALFNAAGTAYRQPLEYEATGSADSRGFVVRCGPWFIGTVSSRFNDDDSLGKRRRARMVHLHRLLGEELPGDVGEVDDVPEQLADPEVDGDAPDGYDPDADPGAQPLTGVEDEVTSKRRARKAPAAAVEGTTPRRRRTSKPKD